MQGTGGGMRGMRGGGPPGAGVGVEMQAPPRFGLQTFSSLRNRNYRIYFAGTLAGFVGMQMQFVARLWLVTDLMGVGSRGMGIALVGAATAIPILVFSLPGGAVADRVPKRNLLIATQGASLSLTGIIAILILLGQIRLWHLVAYSILFGAVMSFNLPARQSFVIELVGRRDLMNAIALNSGAMNLTRIVAPATAGFLVAWFGVGGVYIINVCAYLVVIGTLLALPITGEVELRPDTPMLRDVVDGVRYVRHNPLVLTLLGIGLVPMLFGMQYQSFGVVLVRENWGQGPEALGFLMSVPGVGGLISSLIVASLGDFRHKGKLLIGAALGNGACIAAFALSPTFQVALVPLFFVGGLALAYMAVNNTLLQTNVPDEVRGRVMGLYMMSWGVSPLGTLPLGWVVDNFGAHVAITLGAAIMVVFVSAVAVTQPRVRQLA